MEKKPSKRDKEFIQEFDVHSKDIRLQLSEQLKCLDIRVEQLTSMVTEIQDFFRRRAEVEMEYARGLDKLVKNTFLKHKAEKQKREHWHLFSTYSCWQALLAATKRQSKDHAVLSDIYSNQMVLRFNEIIDDVQRIHKKCKETGMESHEELLKVLNELHTAMKTYHLYHSESRQAEIKLKHVENQRIKLEQTIAKEKLATNRKVKVLDKEYSKKQSKFAENKLKALKSRNEYLLCMESANAAIHKYYVDDISDLVDCVDFGFHNSIARAFMTHISTEDCCRRTLQDSINAMNECISGLDARSDKQRFLEAFNAPFMLPSKFTFRPHKDDEVTQFSAQKNVQEELDQRYAQLSSRLTNLKTESEEIWKTLETAEDTLMKIINQNDYECDDYFSGNKKVEEFAHQIVKRKESRLDTEAFYLKKFREYLLGSNLITRLQAKHSLIRKHLGEDGGSEMRGARPPSLPPKPKKKRIGKTTQAGQPPKLFGGGLEEYLEATGQEIPVIIQSTIRVINLYGLHHQGIFRVSGSQVEINELKNQFEKGDDPLVDITECHDMNSVAGVLKLYFRELREPLFPMYMFEQFISCATGFSSTEEFVEKVRDLVLTLPRSVFVVMRYLFAFLNHLSEFSDENMMDPYNLAICFGPTLLPIPEDRDQVQYHNLVNELVKNIIVYQEDVFPINDGGMLYEKYILSPQEDASDLPDGGQEDLSEEGSDYGYDNSDDESDVFDAVAQYDFEGRSNHELTFRKGTNITLHSQVSPDWWKGSVEGKEGLVPDKYIAVIKSRDSKTERDVEKASVDPVDKRRSTGSGGSGSVSEPPPHPYPMAPSDGDCHPRLTGVSLSANSSATSSPVEEVKTFPEMVHLDSAPVKTRLGSSEKHGRSRKKPSGLTTEDLSKEFVSIQTDVKSDKDPVIDEPKLSKPVIPSDRPDLVCDLPITATVAEPEPRAFAERTSPEMTLADTFAKSNQSTLKKSGGSTGSGTSPGGSPIPSPTENPVFELQVAEPNKRLSTRDLVHKYETGDQPHGSSAPPVEERRPAVRIKPAVLRKPAISPETMRKSPFALRRAQFEQRESPLKEKTPPPNVIRTSDV